MCRDGALQACRWDVGGLRVDVAVCVFLFPHTSIHVHPYIHSAGDLLEQLLRTKKPMTEAQMCRDVAIPMLTCLKLLHSLDIIHRYV